MMVGVKGQKSGQHLVRWKEYRKANNVKIALRDFLALEKARVEMPSVQSDA